MTNKNSKETMEAVTEVARGKGRPPLISEDLFIQVWDAADSLQEVAEVLFPDGDLANRKFYCSRRATALRKAGNELKEFQRGRKANPLVEIEEDSETEEAVAAE